MSMSAVRRFWAAFALVALVALIPGLDRTMIGASPTIETFEGPAATWVVNRDVAGNGVIEASTNRAAAGNSSARIATSGGSGRAQLRVNFSDAASAHTWKERPGTWFWQRTECLCARDHGGATRGERVPDAGADCGRAARTPTAGSCESDRAARSTSSGTATSTMRASSFPCTACCRRTAGFSWSSGLHTQAGPGVKRGFAFLIDGDFYGWYHQGRMQSESVRPGGRGCPGYERQQALRALRGRVGRPWHHQPANGRRQSICRSLAGTGLSNAQRRAVADRLDDLGQFAEAGRAVRAVVRDEPPAIRPQSRSACPMCQMDGQRSKSTGRSAPRRSSPTDTSVRWWDSARRSTVRRTWKSFRSAAGGGQVDLVLEAWDGSGPVFLGGWPMPTQRRPARRLFRSLGISSARGGSRPAPTTLDIRVSFYDASASRWHDDVISGALHAVEHQRHQLLRRPPPNVIGDDGLDPLLDPSIPRRHDRPYPEASSCAAMVSPTSQAFGAAGGGASASVTIPAGCPWTATTTTTTGSPPALPALGAASPAIPLLQTQNRPRAPGR